MLIINFLFLRRNLIYFQSSVKFKCVSDSNIAIELGGFSGLDFITNKQKISIIVKTIAYAKFKLGIKSYFIYKTLLLSKI